jgi:hypothetical protein
MNTKAFIVKSAGFFGVISTLTAVYALNPAKPEEPIIKAPFITESINLKRSTAEIATQDEKFMLDVEFNADYYQDGNGYDSWRDVELIHLKNIRAYDENGELNRYYMSHVDVKELFDTIEQSLRDHL